MISQSTIGKIAMQWLLQTRSANIHGITSNGSFLALDNSQIIFLTSAKDFGPINLLLGIPVPSHWRIHDTIQITLDSGSITFAHKLDSMILSNYELWEVPIAPKWNIDRATQNKRLAQSTNQIQLLKGGKGFSPLLPLLLAANESLFQTEPVIAAILTQLPAFQIAALSPSFEKLLGHGRGLTPSGDDFLIGMLFMLNRFNGGLISRPTMDALNENILGAAKQRTTALSNSLLYCASMGQADFRIQQLADALMNAAITFEDQALQLARWGNSSGADIFAGMIVAIRALQTIK